MTGLDLEAAHRMWAAYREDGNPTLPADLPAVGPFGDTDELADSLLGLVLAGRKRATSSLVAEYQAEGEPLPRIGQHWIITDSAGIPRAIVRTVQLRLDRFLSVDNAHALEEGEGDRSRESWIRSHRAYWQRQSARLGIPFDDDALVLFERFHVTHVPSDRPQNG